MYLVFDIGGTNSRVAFSRDGVSLEKVEVWDTPVDFSQGVEEIVKRAREMAGEGQIVKVGGGIAGVVSKTRDAVVTSPNLPGWVGKPLKTRLQEVLGCDVKLENDAVVGGIGEAEKGAGRRKSLVGFLTIGTGIGGAKIINGRPDDRVNGFEPGHMLINVEGEVKSWEEMSGGRMIEKRYGKKPSEIEDEKIWEEETRLIAVGVHNTIVMWSPEIIVLGGSVIKRIKLEKLVEQVKSMLKIFPEAPPIEIAELGDQAGLVGALSLVTSS